MTDFSNISHKVTIADQSFNIRVLPEDQGYYDRIAKFVEGVHRDIREQGFVGSANQVWAMTAFQIALEFSESREAEAESDAERKERVARMLKRIESAMGKS